MFAIFSLGIAELVILGLIAVGGLVVLIVVLKSTKRFVEALPFTLPLVVFIICAAIAGIAGGKLTQVELAEDGRAYWAFILVFFGVASLVLPIVISLLAILVIVTKAANEMITGLLYIEEDVRKGRSARPPESQGGTGADTGIKPT
jgi:hypothetical protein